MIPQTAHNNRLFTGFGFLFIIVLALALWSFNYWLIILPFSFLLLWAGWQQWEIIFVLLLITLPWSIEFSVNASLSTDLPDEPLMVILAVLFLAHCVNSPGQLKQLIRHPLIFLLLIHFLWIGVAAAFSTEGVIAVKYFLAKAWYLAAFTGVPLLLIKRKKQLQAAALIFLASMLVITLLILYRHYRMGFSFITINDAVSPFFRNHVNYSAMLVCTVPILMAVVQLHKKTRWFTLALLTVMLAALFFSYARGAWLALLAGAISYWLIWKRKLFITYIVAVLVGIAAVFWLKADDRYLDYSHNFRTTVFHQEFNEHLRSTYQLKDISTAERFNRWIAGVRMIGDNWLTGYGPNSFYYQYKPYTIPAFKTWVSDNPERSTVHNYFLLLAIEQGLPGLFFFLLLVGAAFYYTDHLYRRLRERFYKILVSTAGTILVMIVVLNMLSDLIETDKIGSLFFLCISLLVIADLKNRDSKPASHI